MFFKKFFKIHQIRAIPHYGHYLYRISPCKEGLRALFSHFQGFVKSIGICPIFVKSLKKREECRPIIQEISYVYARANYKVD